MPVNSVLTYYPYPNKGFNDSFYPVENYYGVLEAFKLDKTKTIFKFYSHQTPNNNELSELYLSAFDSGFTDTRTSVWNKCINSQSSITQGLNSRLDFNNTSNEAIRLNNVSSNLTRDIAGYDADGSKIGLLRFGKYDNGATNGVKLAVANASNASPDFLSLYLNETTGNCFTRLYQNVIVQNGEIFFGSSNDNNCRIGYKYVTSGDAVRDLPQGTYFFYGTAGTNDSDTQLKGTDFQGFSMRQSGQAMQIVCSGNKVLFRYDDSNTAGTNPQYSAWKQFTLTNA